MPALVIVEGVAPIDYHRLRMDSITETIAGQHFPFQRGEKRLRGSIIETRSNPAHRLPNPQLPAQLGERICGIGATAVGNQPIRLNTDKGCQYTSIRFTQRLLDAGIAPSTGGVGDSFDNALSENLWSTIKIELIYWPAPTFATRAEAQAALFRYIDGWYNPRRIQAGLNGLTRRVRGCLARPAAASPPNGYPPTRGCQSQIDKSPGKRGNSTNTFLHGRWLQTRSTGSATNAIKYANGSLESDRQLRLRALDRSSPYCVDGLGC